MNKLINKDNCLVYGMPGVSILAISLVVSMNIANDFGGSTFVSTISFFGCNVFLWIVYLTIFQYLPLEIVQVFKMKKEQKAILGTPSNTEETKKTSEEKSDMAKEKEVEEVSTGSTEETELEEHSETSEQSEVSEVSHESKSKDQLESGVQSDSEESTEQTTAPEESETSQITIDKDALLKDEKYEQRKIEYDSICNQYRKRLLETLMEYTRGMMSPFLSQDDIILLCKQILEWADNPNYQPTGIMSVKQLTTYDLRHYIWNIAERFDAKDYNCTLRAEFVKQLFPNTMKNIEIASLKNMRERYNVGIIQIDQPAPGSFEFHSMTPCLPFIEKAA